MGATMLSCRLKVSTELDVVTLVAVATYGIKNT